MSAQTQDGWHGSGAWWAGRDSLIQVKAPCGRGDADLPVLGRDHKQVHEVPVHLPVPRGRVPAAHGEYFQALQGLRERPSLRGQASGVGPPPSQGPSSSLPQDPTFQSRFWGCRGHSGRSRLPGRMYSGGVQSMGSISKPFFRFPLSEGPEAGGQHRATQGQLSPYLLMAVVRVPQAQAPSPAPHLRAPRPLAQSPAPVPPAPPRSPSVKTLRKDKELQSTPLKASDGSRLLSRSRTWRTWMRASRTVYGSVREAGRGWRYQGPAP